MSGREFSWGRMALASLGSAALALALTTLVVAVVRPGPGWGLLIVAIGIGVAITSMGVVSTRMTRRGLGDDE
jgi:Na+/melibiose symporter-like transporter